MEESIARQKNENKCTRQRLFILKEILNKRKFEIILALYVAKEWEGTLCSVQNVTLGAQEEF